MQQNMRKMWISGICRLCGGVVRIDKVHRQRICEQCGTINPPTRPHLEPAKSLLIRCVSCQKKAIITIYRNLLTGELEDTAYCPRCGERYTF
jgi:predicted RNA-binding Zn-ribbon protein involved in translation (DUF1610 family)